MRNKTVAVMMDDKEMKLLDRWRRLHGFDERSHAMRAAMLMVIEARLQPTPEQRKATARVKLQKGAK